MVPERGAVSAGASDAGSNGDERGAQFTIGGFWRGCENIGGRIGRAYASRNGAAIAVVLCFGISHPAPRGAFRRIGAAHSMKRSPEPNVLPKSVSPRSNSPRLITTSAPNSAMAMPAQRDSDQRSECA
ncbi:hypothetical protein JAO10_03720 [Burkholderia contaminans]|uniref:Uncharacterized protein n=1 Tax=Burkholderia contaminans TaxID=488447 RepID=A0AAP4VLN8_9BURK|nr:MULTISPECIES: hypothetical protein [Burkholderia]MBD1410124.1 hypothetical protein [Burkholderia contaminans]MBH9666386.1 hypothetical protein [Burkholderia contaminans]MBH9674064.1 hypothetical protein [Burkholderia contaminans]MBH9704110.1 hypothetical protein [Burkholderia contaminans]MBH9719431.1 hypothetical protein [Burkholderia contaminans]